MNFINKVIAFLGERKYLYGVLAGIFIVGGIFIFKNGKIDEKIISVNRSDFISQVSVSGKIVSVEENRN